MALVGRKEGDDIGRKILLTATEYDNDDINDEDDIVDDSEDVGTMMKTRHAIVAVIIGFVNTIGNKNCK